MWVFWLLRLFLNIWVKSCFNLSNYFNFVCICFYIPKLKLFFFFTVLFSFFIEFYYKTFTNLLLYSNCYFWMSRISNKVSQISFKHFDLFYYSFIYLTNKADIELFNYFANGDCYLWCLNLLLLKVCWFLVFDLRLLLFSFSSIFDWGGDVHAKSFHCIFKIILIPFWIIVVIFNTN